jgi:hypothetical protein
MDKQKSFEFARENGFTRPVEKRATEREINRKLRFMQSLPDTDPRKDVFANEVLQWILTR